MSANVEFLTSPVKYEEKHADDKYEQAKFEIVTAQNTTHKISVPQYESKRGVEGLFYCKDKFEEKASDFVFDPDDYFKYFPRILDQVSLRWWNNKMVRFAPDVAWTQAEFDQLFKEFVTHESGSVNPRDDLVAYLSTEECKKPRKVDVRTHANRIETLCLYANRLAGVKPPLTEGEITRIIFHSFPNSWLNDFRLARGNPTQLSCDTIMEYFMTKKAVQDHAEDQNKKRKKEESDNNKPKHGKKQKGNSDTNMCRKHKTHLWSECSENPKSKNYYLNPKSPFYRGGRGGGRDGGRGGYNGGRGNGGRNNHNEYYNSSGRGSGRGYGRSNHGYGGSREQHHNEYRGSDRSADRYDHGNNQTYNYDHHGNGGGRGSQDHHGNNDSYHNNRPGGWY